MSTITDFEVGIHRSGSGTYSVSVRQSSDSSESYEIDVVPPETDVAFNIEEYRDRTAIASLGIDLPEYGQALWDAFLSGMVANRLGQAVAGLRPGERLRLRIFLGPSALELHELLWEALPDPTSPAELGNSPIATSQRLIFSRYLGTQEWQRAELRRKDEMRALVVIANPSDLDAWASRGAGGAPLARIDVDGELRRAKAGLQASVVEVRALASAGRATLDRIEKELAQGVDILYLVCHGQRIGNAPAHLWLEKPDGTADVVAATDFVRKLRRIEHRPRLIVLASCMSAGGDATDAHLQDEGAVTAIGPLLAGLGVPAVLAMQGSFSMESLETFMPTFFTELDRTGRVDQAVAAARASIEHRADAWMPVLFMRLRTGRIWYEPGMVSRDVKQSDVAWRSLVEAICAQRCTVVIGPGLLERIIGAPHTIAHRWAEERSFPLLPSEMDNLPQVAQYVATQEGYDALRDSLRLWILGEMSRRFPSALPENWLDRLLSENMVTVGRHLRATEPQEPHEMLARLPFPVYITTNPDDLLADALASVGRPNLTQRIFSWNDHDGDDPYRQRDPDDLDLEPSWDEPLVYHVYGHFSDPKSILLTEDNYFDYLIHATNKRETIPPVVRAALTDRMLLFIGFQMHDWDFRVLLRIIANQMGKKFMDYRHVAVQVYPEDDRVEDPGWIRRFLENYFQTSGIGNNPAVFWGSSADFVRELSERWKAAYGEFPTYPIEFGTERVCTCDPRRVARGPRW